MSYSPPSDFGLQVSRGLVSGITSVNKFGRCPNGVQTTASDVWSRCDATPTQQIWVAPTTARIHSLASTSINDTSAGTGARTVKVFGLTSWTTAEVNETVTLNGLVPVNTTNSYVIIHRIIVITSGSASVNAGIITATAATDLTVTAQIDVGQGQTQMTIYGVPSTQSFYLKALFASINDATAATRVDVEFRVNENPNVQLLNFVNRRDFQLANNGSSAYIRNLELPTKYVGPCIIKMQATASGADIDLSAGYDGYLVTN